MPSFTGNFNPSVGPLVEVSIFPFEPDDGKQKTLRDQNIHVFTALMDTGASSTCLSPKIVESLGLAPIGQAPMIGATGQKTVNQYAFMVGFMHGHRQMPDGTISGQMATIPTQGMEFDAGGSVFDVLLGRDVLCNGIFTISFDGHWSFGF